MTTSRPVEMMPVPLSRKQSKYRLQPVVREQLFVKQVLSLCVRIRRADDTSLASDSLRWEHAGSEKLHLESAAFKSDLKLRSPDLDVIIIRNGRPSRRHFRGEDVSFPIKHTSSFSLSSFDFLVSLGASSVAEAETQGRDVHAVLKNWDAPLGWLAFGRSNAATSPHFRELCQFCSRLRVTGLT